MTAENLNARREQEREEFKEACKPLIAYMQKHCCPHDTVLVTQTDAELVSGQMCVGYDFNDRVTKND